MRLSEFPDVGKVKDVAAVLDCDPKSVYGLIHDGHLFAARVGSSFRIPKSALFAFLGVGHEQSDHDPGLRVVGDG